MNKEMICIVCPKSCHLSIEIENNKVFSVKGNTCPRGKEYAISECLHPERMLTSTVRIKGAIYPRCPVITSKPIPLGKMMDVMKYLDTIDIHAPIKCNDIIVENICECGVDLLASRTMEKIK